MSLSSIYLGLDIHKDSITITVLPADAQTPFRVDRPAQPSAVGAAAPPECNGLHRGCRQPALGCRGRRR